MKKEQVKTVLDKYIRDYNIVEVHGEWLTVFFNQCYVQFLFEEKTVEIYDGIKNKWKLTYSELKKQLDGCHKTGGFWDRNYNMLKELLSFAMADGECPQSALEQPFEFRDEARCILQSHAVEQSVEEAEKTCITEDGFARIYASDLVIVIQPEEEVMHISTLEPAETFTHDFCEWDNMDAVDFPFHEFLGYVWWLDHLKPALFEIIEFLESPDTSSEPSLEERIREEAKRILGQNYGLTYGSSDCDYIEFTGANLRYWVRRNLIITRGKDKSSFEERNKEYTLDEFLQTTNVYKDVIKQLVALLTPSIPEPTESEAEMPDDAIEEANAIIIDLRLKLARTENHLKHWKERAELRERERDASRLEYGKLMTKYQEIEDREGDADSYTEGKLAACEKELKKLKEEHHELNEKHINHSSVYEHKIEQQEERICKLIDRLKLYQAAYEQEFLKSMEPKKGVSSDS